jgi:hypothetical protein
MEGRIVGARRAEQSVKLLLAFLSQYYFNRKPSVCKLSIPALPGNPPFPGRDRFPMYIAPSYGRRQNEKSDPGRFLSAQDVLRRASTRSRKSTALNRI